jgi:hypothetical protein
MKVLPGKDIGHLWLLGESLLGHFFIAAFGRFSNGLFLLLLVVPNSGFGFLQRV